MPIILLRQGLVRLEKRHFRERRRPVGIVIYSGTREHIVRPNLLYQFHATPGGRVIFTNSKKRGQARLICSRGATTNFWEPAKKKQA
jgi:hypothetical protein